MINGVLPQVTPYMIAHLLYTFEVNVHSATILGTVGAGGIGFLFLQYIQFFQYDKEATVLIVVILMTMIHAATGALTLAATVTMAVLIRRHIYIPC